MTALIYLLMLTTVIGVFYSIFRFFRLMASFASLISTTNEVGREQPLVWVLTGAFVQMWQVLRHSGDAYATKTLFKNLIVAIGSFAFTFASAATLKSLNTKYCVFNMTTSHSDGTGEVICPPVSQRTTP